MIIGLPSGIGDISWALSKLINSGEHEYEIADGWPQRSREYVEMVPGVKSAQYGDFAYDDILAFSHTQGFLDPGVRWEEIAKRGYERILIEPNRHLEMGRPLKDWLPDLETSYHYEVNIPSERVKQATDKLAGLPRPLICVSAASYRGSEAWKTWSSDSWSEFLALVRGEYGLDYRNILLVGGFWDDLTDALGEEGYPCFVGKTHIGTMLSILQQTEYYVGFSSGLGIMRTVFKKNAFMLWPDFQVALSTSWAPPYMLESGEYVAVLWREPREVFKRFKVWMKNNGC